MDIISGRYRLVHRWVSSKMVLNVQSEFLLDISNYKACVPFNLGFKTGTWSYSEIFLSYMIR